MTFPFTGPWTSEHDGPLPDAADVLVIGGGIIGVMTTYFLALRGVRVVLCEKGRIAGEQSSRNWGWVRQQGRDPAELPIMIEALSLWRRLQRAIGEDIGLRQEGVLYLANAAKDLEGFEAWLPHAREHGLDTRMLSRGEVAAMLRHAADWKGGLWTASDARAEPWVAVPALARAAARAGAVIREHCAVRGIDVASGRVAGVVTEAGRIRADRVVLAGGAWSSLLARVHGVDLPQLSVRATVAATVPLPQVFAGNAADGHFAFRRRLDGGYSIAPGGAHEFWTGPDALRHFGLYLPQLRRDRRSTRFRALAPKGYPDAWGTPRHWDADRESPFERCRVLDPPPNMRFLDDVRSRFGETFPSLGRPGIAAAWAGMIDVMPDTVPVVDHVATLPGLTIATGMSGHGFGIGPGFGRVVADLVEGRAPGHDLSRFRLSRFTDGSKIDLGPSL
ncbi:FAD-binding oxidoreductase [Ostreiculturibacter nitratireducens]|uniref:NAD(P)/FAD-dependent oxidoreductase n=1 Tax=Ostreiculturibacter nitratireducens TaxID=3075226 RepID=UPI0031B58722